MWLIVLQGSSDKSNHQKKRKENVAFTSDDELGGRFSTGLFGSVDFNWQNTSKEPKDNTLNTMWESNNTSHTRQRGSTGLHTAVLRFRVWHYGRLDLGFFGPRRDHDWLGRMFWLDLTENQKKCRGLDSSTLYFIEEHLKLAIETINCLLR